MPQWIPFTAIAMTEITSMANERPNQKRRRRMKSNLESLKIWNMRLPSDAQRFDVATLAEHEVVDEARHEHRREDRAQESRDQRHREALHGTGPVPQEEQRGDDRRHVRVD